MRHGTKRLFAAVSLTIEQSTPVTSLSFEADFFGPYFLPKERYNHVTPRFRYLRWNNFPPLLVNANCTRSNELNRFRYLRWNHFSPLLVNANCTRSNELATQIYLEFHIYTYARVKSFEFLDILLWWTWTVFHFQTLLLVSKTRMNLDRRTRKHLLCECFLSPYCSPGVATSWYQDYRLGQSKNLTKFFTHGIEIRHQLSNLCRTWLLTAQVGLIWSSVTHSLTRLTSFINVMLLGGSGHF